MKLTLQRCTVRPWRLNDGESIASHANNRKVWLVVRDRFPHPYTIQDTHEFLQRATTEQPEMKFCIEVRAPLSAGSVFIRVRTCIGIQRQWVTGWASNSGDGAS